MTKHFCPLPWMHLATHPNGEVTLCCQSEMADDISVARNWFSEHKLNLGRNSIHEIMNSDLFKEVRLSMLRDERHPTCVPCYDREDKGFQSKRQKEIKRYDYDLYTAQKVTALDGTIPTDIRFAELRLGNNCNLKCVTCNPNSSAAHRSDFSAMRDEFGLTYIRDYSLIPKSEYFWTEESGFWQDFETSSPKLETIYINGGEPTLIKKHWDFLRLLIEKNLSLNINLHYSINLTNIPEYTEDIWKNFKSVRVEASIDDLNLRNFYIRYPSNWANIIKNLQTLNQTSAQVTILQTVSVLNFYYLAPFYRFFRLMFPKNDLQYNDVVDPRYYSAQILPAHIRQEILKDIFEELPEYLTSVLKNMFVSNETDPAAWRQFKEVTMAYDKMRELDVREYFPEYEKFLNGFGESLYLKDSER